MNQVELYLASASPRRAQLLDQMTVQYTVIKPDVDESQIDSVDPIAYSQRVAISKAIDGQQKIQAQQLKCLPIVAADTIVVLDQHILGKPKNSNHAQAMLSKLSARTHKVYSSVCVIHQQFNECITQISKVTFRPLKDDEIQRYCQSDEPFDKAGSYAIQGQAAQFVSNLNGSYSGVMGLPIFELFQLLAKLDL